MSSSLPVKNLDPSHRLDRSLNYLQKPYVEDFKGHNPHNLRKDVKLLVGLGSRLTIQYRWYQYNSFITLQDQIH